MIPLDRIQVILPALNEADTIAPVVNALRALGLPHIRVIDNGSTDTTAALARSAGAEVIAEPRRGYGQACFTGAQILPAPIEWLLFADADGSDNPADIPRLIAAAANADFILGDRRATPAGRAVMTPVQRFGNALSTSLIRLNWRHRYHDLGPLRLIRRSLYEQIQMRDRGFGWTIEMQVRAIECGARIVELPVDYRRRAGGQSKISGTIRGSLAAGIIILSTLARLAFRQATLRHGLAAALVLLGALLMFPHGDASLPGSAPKLMLAAAVMSLGWWIGNVGACLQAKKPSQTSGVALACKQAPTFKPLPLWLLLAVALLARLILLPMQPGDDVWRYLWEGKIQLYGFSPYTHPPADPALVDLRTATHVLINHPEKTAIYPPVAQLVFRALAAFFSENLLAWKLAFIAADLALCLLLARRFGATAALFFAWNPLVLYATAGGAHFESLLLLPLVYAWLALEKQKDARAAFALGLSIGIKWITAPLLGWLVWQHRRTPLRAVLLLLVGLLPVAAALLVFRLQFGPLGTLWPSEFVAKARSLSALPYLVDLVRQPVEITNHWIPFLFLPLASVALLFSRTFLRAAENYFAVLLLCLPSIHAWYFVWLAPWAVASGNWGTRLLSLSGFVYFWIWETHTSTGRWHQSPLEHALVWLPFVLGWIAWKYFQRPSLPSPEPFNHR